MIIKIFTKRKPGGQPVKIKGEWIDEFIEAETIRTKREGDKVDVCLSNPDSIEEKTINLLTHGYHIYNNAGVIIERYVTNLKPDQQ